MNSLESSSAPTAPEQAKVERSGAALQQDKRWSAALITPSMAGPPVALRAWPAAGSSGLRSRPKCQPPVVDPAYTSKWGAQHWLDPLKAQYPQQSLTGHHAAAVAIGRSGL